MIRKSSLRGNLPRDLLIASLALSLAPLGALCGEAPTASRPRSVLDRTITGIRGDSMSMLDVVDSLGRKGIVTSLEETRLEEKDRIGRTSLQASWRRKRFSLDMGTCTVRQLLDAVVKAAPEYAYSCSESTGMIHVFPKRGSVLDWTIPSATIQETPLTALIAVPESDLLGLQKHGLVPAVLMGNFAWTERPITLRLENVHIRETLALVLRASGGPRSCYRAGVLAGRPYFSFWGSNMSLPTTTSQDSGRGLNVESPAPSDAGAGAP